MPERDTDNDRVSRRVTIDLPSASRSRDGNPAADPFDREKPVAADRDAAPPDVQSVERDLNSLDHAMAEHADVLLDGAFESVEEVLSRAGLEDLNENQSASPADGMEDDPAILARATSELESGESEASSESEPTRSETTASRPSDDELESRSAGSGSEAAAPVSEMIPSRDSSVAQEPDESGDETADVRAIEDNEQQQEPAPAVAADDEACDDNELSPAASEGEVIAKSSEAAVADELDHSQEPAEEREPAVAECTVAPDMTGRSEKDSVRAEPAPEGDRTPITHRVRKLTRRGVLGIAALLTIISAPLQLLPPPLRPLADWLALSLIFWVPIVWVLVLLLS